MKKIIDYIERKLKNDILMYYIFKFIILNLNIVFFIVSSTINIIMYVTLVPIGDGGILMKIMLLNNILLSIMIACHLIWNFVCYIDSEPYFFDTNEYKRIFNKLKYKS